MHPRRTLLAALAVLLATSGCVAPAPPPRPALLAPAADRPPAPLSAWTAPAPAPPREALDAAGPDPGPSYRGPPC
ncbi:hypothetical protein [Streptomyces sp. S1]|uniref:hypothetical protein n=1 Tax=Streptomyces sp. S1 TaxID=718288 RepID=UPI003D765098